MSLCCAFASAALTLHLLAGCATPAVPTTAASATPANIRSATPALDGEYDITFHSRWFGPMTTRMTAQPTPAGFKANTQPGVAWNLVGGLQGVLGPVLAPYIFPRGMLLMWESTTPDPTTGRDGEGWIGISTIGPFRAKTRTPAAGGPTKIQASDGRVVAVLNAEPSVDSRSPQTDYAAIIAAAQSTATEHLFDSAVASSPQFAAYFTDIRAALPHINDDISLAFSLGLAWRKHPDLPFLMIYRRANAESAALLDQSGGALTPITVTHDTDGDLAVIEAISFENAAAVDEAFATALLAKPKGLVLDLRNCAGFGAASLRVLAWLSAEPVPAGRFIGAADQDAASTADGPPHFLSVPADFELSSCSPVAIGPAPLVVQPVKDPFRGPVVIVTSGRTRSTAEGLVWLLSRSGRATTVGGRTAGSPMISTEHGVGDEYVLRLPEFDWISPKGRRLTDGLKPTISADSDSAVARAKKTLRQTTPPESPQ